MIYLIIAIVGVLAGVISGIVGTGSSILLLPILAYTFGTKEAIPIMAIVSVMGNISRVILWYKDIDFKAFFLYSITGVPAVILGANTLWIMPVMLSNICIGVFFFLLIPLRHWGKSKAFKLNKVQLSFAGGVTGYLTGIVFSTGPITVPVFAGYGLIKGSLLSTEAAASFTIYLAKAFTFEAIGALPWSVFISGVLVGSTLIVGLYIGKRFVLKMPEKIFDRLIDTMILVAGISMFWDVFK